MNAINHQIRFSDKYGFYLYPHPGDHISVSDMRDFLIGIGLDEFYDFSLKAHQYIKVRLDKPNKNRVPPAPKLEAVEFHSQEAYILAKMVL